MQILGDFELYERVARGGMAEVWRARHTRTGNRTAVKVAPPSDAVVANRWMQEITAVTRIHHPCTLEVLGFGTAGPGPLVEEGSLFYGMPWAAGGSLADNRPGSWPEVLAALQAMLRGLAAAHVCGVLHLDVKPANLLRVFGPDDVRLSDFGISLQSRDWSWTLAGTPAYLAPEQAAGAPGELGPWTDLYAVGAVAWHWTTGGPLFAGTPTEVAQAHLVTPPPAFEPQMAVPAGLEDLLRTLLRKRAFDRTEMAADVVDALDQLGSPDQAPAVSGDSAPEARTWSFSGPLEPLLGSTTHAEAEPLMAASAVPDWRMLQYAPRWSEAPSPALAMARTEWTLVGRDDEIDQLWRALQQVRRGTPRAVLLSGPPGIGREQLVQWISSVASISGQAGGLYHKPDPASPLEGLHGLFSVPYSAAHNSASALRARLLEEGEDLVTAELLVQVMLEPDRVDEHAAVEALARHVTCLSRRRPLVVALSDLQASELRTHFAATVLSQRAPALVVASVGGVESWSPAVTSLAGHPRVDVLELEPLADDRIATLLGRRLPLAPQLVGTLLAQAAGRPARALALLRELVDGLQLERTPDGWALAGATTPASALDPRWADDVRAGLQHLWSGELASGRQLLGRTLTEAAHQGPWRPTEAWLGLVAADVLEGRPARALNRLCRPVLDAGRPAVRVLRHLVSAMAWAQLGDLGGARHHLAEASPLLRGEPPLELQGPLRWLADPEHHGHDSLATHARALLEPGS